MIRFNEAIDQAVAESVAFFAAHVRSSRNLLLERLNYDLRNSLRNIQMAARLLQALNSEGEVGLAAERLVRSGAHMQQLLDDLQNFNRTEPGLVAPGRDARGRPKPSSREKVGPYPR
jgi:signal transduction histidine kinase